MLKKEYIHDDHVIELQRVTRIYPAALISAGGESASVSLEWADLKKDQIVLEAYVLVCDFDPVGEEPVNRIELRFPTKEKLFEAMHDIAQLLQK